MATARTDDLTGPTTELLQALIRNECVNDGTPDSGHETRNAELLGGYLEGTGVGIEHFEKRSGRASVVARIEGSDPDAPTLCLMGHTDVVPVNPAGWSRDPFGGELVDGEVWGRGAIDMLNVTASMAVAFRQLARSGWKPKGTLVYFGVADEEAGGVWGAEWMCDQHWDAVGADYVLTELGGWSSTGHDGVRRVVVNTGEKGLAWRTLRVSGTPAHGSMPFGSDNALVTAAEVVRRLATYRPQARIDDVWRQTVAAMPLSEEVRAGLVDPAQIWPTLQQLPPALAKRCHAHTHTTFSPNVVHGGQKTNIIPDLVELEVDIRTVPGTTQDEVDAHLREALGDLAARVEIGRLQGSDATESPRGNALWDAISSATQVAYPGAELLPGLIVGGTDARFFRDKGSVAYGTGLFSSTVDFESFGSRFHGNDERIDVESLGLAADFWIHIAKRICG
ncbi:MAG: M20/M25/M40 family metallo-hydrolase [Acidimicrobiales bacterium]|nr:M20/M25/M40 family metallo-hydrolase [Acidimicrobiales bacterium]MCB9394483.1 M20/M25/M40 family metallo-hydrolase [Acidimicrobiaceae bacterium]